MKIGCFCYLKNEEFVLPRFLEHHSRIFDEINIVDSGSTDSTVNILSGNPNVNLFHDRNDFSWKHKILGRIVQQSNCDLAVFLDADELVCFQSNSEISLSPEKIRGEFLSCLSKNADGFLVKNRLDYIPHTRNLFGQRQKNPKFFVKKDAFIDTDIGFHKLKTKNKSIDPSNISFLHFKYVNHKKWLESNEKIIKTMMPVIDVERLKNWRGRSVHAAQELYKYYTTGIWFEAKKYEKFHEISGLDCCK